MLSIFLNICRLLQNFIVFCNRCVSKARKLSTSLPEDDLEVEFLEDRTIVSGILSC